MARRVSSLLEEIPSRSHGLVWLVVVVAGVAGFAASVRAIVSSFGLVDAVGAGVILILFLLLWLAWGQQQGLRRALAATAGGTALRETIRQLEQEREDYERELFSIAIRSQRPITESIRIVYQIGDLPAGDRTTLFNESIADNPKLPIRWAILQAWSDGHGAVVRSFRELTDVEAYEQGPDGEQKMKVLDIGRHSRGLTGLAFFSTELGTTSRRWRWSYTWPGAWASLRERNSDWSEYDLRPGHNEHHRITQLVVSFQFPAQAREPRVESVPGTPPCVREADLNPRTGGPVFTCQIDDPKPSLLHWNLRVASWA